MVKKIKMTKIISFILINAILVLGLWVLFFTFSQSQITEVVAAPVDWKISAVSAQVVWPVDQEGAVNEPVWGYLINGRLGLIAIAGGNPTTVLSKPPQKAELDNIPNRMELLNKIIFCESRWDEKAQNPISSACGLGQIIDRTWKNEMRILGLSENSDCLDGEINLKATKSLFAREGVEPWRGSELCWGS